MKKKMFGLLTAFLMIFMFSLPAFATDDWSGYQEAQGTLTATGSETLTPTEGNGILSATDDTHSSDVHIEGRDSYVDSDLSTKIKDGYIDVMPVVTTDDVLQWAVTKGNEIIYLLQVICQPFAIIIFIIAAFITLVGAIGKGDLVGKGIFSMIISCVVYAAALYAPVILQTFVGWVAS